MPRAIKHLRAEALQLLKRAADLEQQVEELVRHTQKAKRTESENRRKCESDALSLRFRQTRSDFQQQLRDVIAEAFTLATKGLNDHLQRILQEHEQVANQQYAVVTDEHIAALSALVEAKLESPQDAQALGQAYSLVLAQIERHYREGVVALRRIEVQARQETESSKQREDTEAIKGLELAQRTLQMVRTAKLAASKARMQKALARLSAARREVSAHLTALRCSLAEATDRLHLLNARLLECAPRIPLHLRSWADADWQPFIPPSIPPQSACLRVGFRAFNDLDKRPLELPMLVNLFERSQLWFQFIDPDIARQNQYMGSLILRLFASLPPGYLRLVIFDPVHLGSEPQLRVFANYLKDPEFRIIVTPSDLERHCDELISSAANVNARLPYHYGSVFQMNRDSPVMKESHTVILLRSLPRSKDARALERLKVIVDTGQVSGLHVLGILPPVVDARSQKVPSELDLQELPFTPDPIVEVCDDRVRIVSRTEALRQGTIDTLYAPAFVAQTLETIRQAITNPRHIPRSFKEFVAKGAMRFSEYSRVAAEAPLAYDREYNHLINIRFDSEHYFHALVVGMTGQGKSSVLHRIIVGLSSRYSPSEVQFVLIDDKKGVAFDRYRKLPHVRLLSLRGSHLNTLAILEHLVREMDSRYLAMRGQADSLSSYRTKTGDEMPRLLLVWDEAYEAFTDANPLADAVIDSIRRLADQGRAAGIHLVLATNHGQVYQIRRVTDMIPIRINLPHKDADVFADWHKGTQSTVPKRKGQAQFVGFDPDELERPQLVNLLEPEFERTDEWWTETANEIADSAVAAGHKFRARIFDGTALVTPAQHAGLISARLSTNDQRIPLFLGELVSRIADFPLCLNLEKDSSDNLLLLGGRDVFPALMARHLEFLRTWYRKVSRCELLVWAQLPESARTILKSIDPTIEPFQPGPYDPDLALEVLERAVAGGNDRQTIFIWGLERIAQLSQAADILAEAPSRGSNIVAWSRAETVENLTPIESCLESFKYKAVMTADRHMLSRFTDIPFVDPGPNCATLIESRRTTLAFAPYASDQPLLSSNAQVDSTLRVITG